MAGVLPKTAYLLTRCGVVVGTFDNLSSIAYYLGIQVCMKTGKIMFLGEEMSVTYCVDPRESGSYNGHFSSLVDVIVDFSRHHLRQNLPANYKIYRYLV